MAANNDESQQEAINVVPPAPGSYSQGPKRNLAIFLLLSFVTLIHAFESTVLCVALPTIAAELDASLGASLTLVTVFLLCTTLSQPLSSELSWIFGRRPAFVLATLIFIIGSVVCGVSKNISILLVGRAIQGAGAGAAEPLKALILHDLFPLRKRAKWLALMNGAWAIGIVAGPILGGVYSDHPFLTWRWIFWTDLPFLGVSLLGSVWLLGYDKRPRVSQKLLRSVDWLGLILFALSGATLLLGLSWAGSGYSWASARVLVPFIMGVASFGVLVYNEMFLTKCPIFRPAMFRKGSMGIHLHSMYLHGLLMWMMLYCMSIYYLGVKGNTPLEAGVWALPVTLTAAPMALVVGVIVHWTGYYRFCLLVGWALVASSFGTFTILDKDSGLGQLIGLTVMAGASFGMLIPSMSIGISATVNPRDTGHAICMIFLMRPAGQTMGLAMGLTLFVSRLNLFLSKRGFPHNAAQDLMEYIHSPLYSGLGDSDTIIEGVLKARNTVFYFGAALAGAAVFLTLIARCPDIPEDREDEGNEENEEVQVPDNNANDGSDDGLIELFPPKTPDGNEEGQYPPVKEGITVSPRYRPGDQNSDATMKFTIRIVEPSGEDEPIPAPLRPVRSGSGQEGSARSQESGYSEDSMH